MLRNAFQKLVGIFVFAVAFAVAGPAGAVTGNVTLMANDVAQTGGFTLELTDEATGESIGTFTDTDGDGTVEVAVDDEDSEKCVVATIKDRDGKVIRRIPCFIIPLLDGFSLYVDITPGRVTTVSAAAPPPPPALPGVPLIIFDPFFSFTNQGGDGEVEHVFNGPERGSGSSNDASFGLRVRAYLPNGPGGVHLFVLANGRLPPATPGVVDLVDVRLHPGNNDDTFYTLERRGMLEAGVGVTFSTQPNGAPCGAPGTPPGCWEFSPWVSLAGQNVESNFSTDETGGSGNRNRVSETDTLFGFGIGATVATGVELPNGMYFAPFIDIAGRFWQDPDPLDLNTAPSNFDYNTDTSLDPEFEVRIGVGIPLDSLTNWFDRIARPRQ